MHILHVTREQGNDARYGIRKSLTPVITSLIEMGHKVEIMDHKMATTVSSNKFESLAESLYLKFMRFTFGKNSKVGWQVLAERVIIGRKAAKYAAKNKVSHVHCHDPLLGYTYDFFALLYGSTKKWGYTIHSYGRFVKLREGISTNKKSISFLQRWEKKAMHKSSWVIIPTRSGLKQMMHDFQLSKTPPNWHIAKHAVTKKTGNRSSIRSSLGVKNDDILVIAVGQLIPMKRFSLLLESVALLPFEIQPYVLILGEGQEKKSLILLAKKLNLSGRFKIKVSDKIGDYFSAADIYVSVSSTESFGMANCEAVVAGIPSVCTAVDAVPELLNQCALMVKGEPKEISTAIKRLLISDIEKEKLLKQARAITSNWPKPSDVALIYEKIYNTC
jgi:glycosyltransferase involved in cell wall biosynthesis